MCSNASKSRTAAAMGPPAELRRERLVWRPGADRRMATGSVGSEGPPAGSEPTGAGHSILRSCLADARLAQDVMRRVLHLEAVLVSRVRNLEVIPDAPPDLKRRWQDMGGKGDIAACRLDAQRPRPTSGRCRRSGNS